MTDELQAHIEHRKGPYLNLSCRWCGQEPHVFDWALEAYQAGLAESASLRTQLRNAWAKLECRCIFNDRDEKTAEDPHCPYHGVYQNAIEGWMPLAELRTQLEEAQAERNTVIAGFPWEGDLGGKTLAQAMADEMHDYEMIIDHCTQVYMEASYCAVSKPTTLPVEVISIMHERQQQDIDEAVKEATEDLKQQLEAAREQGGVMREALQTAQRDLLGVQATTTAAYDSVSILGQDVFNDCFFALRRIDAALSASEGEGAETEGQS